MTRLRTAFVLTTLVLALVGCEQVLPTSPTTDDQNAATSTVIINIGGDTDTPSRDPDDPPTNAPPQVRNPGPQNNVAGDDVLLVISVFDPDAGDTVTCTLSGAPRGLTIDVDSCIIRGIISSSSPEDSPFVAQVVGSDGKAQDSEQFVWNVEAPEDE